MQSSAGAVSRGYTIISAAQQTQTIPSARQESLHSAPSAATPTTVISSASNSTSLASAASARSQSQSHHLQQQQSGAEMISGGLPGRNDEADEVKLQQLKKKKKAKAKTSSVERVLTRGEKKPSSEFTQLSEMFPAVEDRVVESVLVTSGNNLEAAIDQLLRIPSGQQHQRQKQQQQQPDAAPPSQVVLVEPEPEPESAIHFDLGDGTSSDLKLRTTGSSSGNAQVSPKLQPVMMMPTDTRVNQRLQRGSSRELIDNAGGISSSNSNTSNSNSNNNNNNEEEEEEAALVASSSDFGLYNADDQGSASVECLPITSRRKLNWGDIKREEIKGQPTKLQFAHGVFGTTYEAQLVDSQGSKIAVKIVQPLAGVNIDRLFEEFVQTYK